jgi:hypothetical protein
MAISVILTFNSIAYDVSDYVVKDSIEINESLFTDLAPNTSTAKLKLSRSCPYLDEIFAWTDPIQIAISNNSVPAFTGYLTDDHELAVSPHGIGDIELDAEDQGIKILQRAWVSTDGLATVFNGPVCDASTPATSFVHVLAALAGVTLSGSLPTISTTVNFSVADKDEEEYWDVLEGLLSEFLYTFYFDAAGALCLYAFNGLQGTATEFVTTQGTILSQEGTKPGIILKKRRYNYREITVEFDETETIAAATVFKDTTNQSSTHDCVIPLSPGEYYPKSCDASTYAFIDYFLDDDRDIVSVASAVADFEYETGIVAEFDHLGTSGRIRFYNGAATIKNITQIRVAGTTVVAVSANSKQICGESGKTKKKVQAKFIHAQADALTLGNLLYYYYKNSTALYEFRSYLGTLYPADTLFPSSTLYPMGDPLMLGDLVRLYDPLWTGLDVTVVITEKTYILGRDGATYKAVGVGAINLGDIGEYVLRPRPVTPIIDKFPTEKPLLNDPAGATPDAVDFDGQYGIYQGYRYVGTMPTTWVFNDILPAESWVKSAGITFDSADTIRKSGASSAWDAHAYTVNGYGAGGTLQFSPGALISAVVGLDSAPANDTTQLLVGFTWRLSATGKAKIQKNGVDLIATEFDYTSASIFKVRFIGAAMEFYPDGTLVHTDTTPSASVYYVDAWIYTPGGIIGALSWSFDASVALAYADAVGDASDEYADTLAGYLHDQLDKSIVIVDDAAPYSDPSTAWTTAALKRAHHQDIWHKVADATAPYGSAVYGTWWKYVWVEATLAGSWVQITAGPELTALQNAAAAQGSADKKTTIWADLATAQSSAVAGDLFMASGLFYECLTALAATYERVTPKRWQDGTTLPEAVEHEPLLIGDSFYLTTTSQWYAYTATGWIPDGQPQSSVWMKSGNVVFDTADTIRKTGATASWDAQAYSINGQGAGAMVQFQPGATGIRAMMGLNQDPSTDASFSSLDRVFYFREDGSVHIYESGVDKGEAAASYTADTVAKITYDGTVVHYWIDGTELTAFAASVGAGKIYYVDSSIYSPGSSIKNIRWSMDTGQVVALAPAYLGRVAYASLSATAGNENDTILAYSTTIAYCGIYKRVSGSWVDQTTPTSKMISDAWTDVLWANANGYPSTGTAAEKIQAFLGSGTSCFETLAGNELFVATIKAVSGFFEDITVTGKATLSEIVINGFTAGNNLVRSDDDTVSGYQTSLYVIAKARQICGSGVIRVSYDINSSNSGTTVYGKIYINDVAVDGTEQSTNSTTPVTKTNDVTITDGDIVQLYVKGSSGVTIYISNFRLSVAENPGILKYMGTP